MVGGRGVLVNGQPALKTGQRVQAGDEVTANVPEVVEDQRGYVVPALPLSILYEDEVMLVVDKLADVPLHPGKKSARSTAVVAQNTVAQQLTELDPAIAHVGGAGRAGIVMRLETEASGALLVAKDEETYRALQRSGQARARGDGLFCSRRWPVDR